MLIHSVRFYLKPELSAERRAAVRSGLETLRGIPDVKQLFVGAPAAVPARPVLDAAYTFALTVVFEDVAAHDRYQAHAIHQAFLTEFRGDWERVAVFDAA